MAELRLAFTNQTDIFARAGRTDRSHADALLGLQFHLDEGRNGHADRIIGAPCRGRCQHVSRIGRVRGSVRKGQTCRKGGNFQMFHVLLQKYDPSRISSETELLSTVTI